MLLSLATGGVIDAALGGSKGKLSGEHALLRSLHGRLRPGDIVLADAYYSSFDEVVTLVGMGVDVVMRRSADGRPTSAAAPSWAARTTWSTWQGTATGPGG